MLSIEGIIANFKANYRTHQYRRATDKQISGIIDDLKNYRMNEVEALFYLADAWLKIEPSTISKCWKHTSILAFKDEHHQGISENLLQSEALPLEDSVLEEINDLIPDLPGNDSGLVTSAAELDLYADEAELITTEPSPSIELENGTEEDEDIISASFVAGDEGECDVNIVQSRSALKRAFQDILCHTVPIDEDDRILIAAARRKLNEIRCEEVVEKKQTLLSQFFQPAREDKSI